MKKVTVISVHPDDETLGCGGTLFKHKACGDSINCIFVTSGNADQRKMIAALEACYGFDTTICLDLSEITLADMPLGSIIGPLSQALNRLRPEILYIPNRSDVHSDHRKVFEALMACTKAFRYPYIEQILMCEVISETDFAPALTENAFVPNVYVDISFHMQQKREAIAIFQSELMEEPYTRSLSAIEALSRYRGSQINALHAESFMLLKMIR